MVLRPLLSRHARLRRWSGVVLFEGKFMVHCMALVAVGRCCRLLHLDAGGGWASPQELVVVVLWRWKPLLLAAATLGA